MRMKQNMGTKTSWSVMLLMLIFFVACSTNDTPLPERPSSDTTPTVEPVKTAAEVLATIQGVSDIQETKDAGNYDVTTFCFEQPIDHSNPAAGTFKQYCTLHYKGPNEVTVLHTQGYSSKEPKEMKQNDFITNLDGNFLEVEHRYYMHSPINKGADYYDPNYWAYNTAAQSTADLHAIVTVLKNTGCFKGKWVSTGVSKDGILTALYAYYYPNEMDVYVPFCAPFCTEAESTGIGKWLTRKCAEGSELQRRVWEILGEMATDTKLREEMTLLHKQANPNNAYLQNYNVKQTMCLLIYEYMKNMFHKFSYYNTDTWDGVIPPKGYDAKFYYLFTMLGKDGYARRLNELRALWNYTTEEELNEYEYDTYDDYETDDEDDDWQDIEDVDGEAAARRSAQAMTFESLMKQIYLVHAAKELGYFLYDWTVLPENHVLPATNLEWFKKVQSITTTRDKYRLTYDDGKLMKDFLDFVKNNRNRNKCKMLFVYGGNDPWTGAAIPDPDPDDPYVKKYVVAGGVHSGNINYTGHYTAQDKGYIMNTVKLWLRGELLQGTK